jgi:hypothetical protein
VFVDIDERTFNIDPSLIEAAITPRTKAIMPVHLYGRPCEMDAIMDIAERHGLEVIEDCAQSFGARYQGRMTGTFGRVGAYSFFPTKNLGAFGDGGLIATDDDRVCRTRADAAGAREQEEVPPRDAGLQQPAGCAAGGDAAGEVAACGSVEVPESLRGAWASSSYRFTPESSHRLSTEPSTCSWSFSALVHLTLRSKSHRLSPAHIKKRRRKAGDHCIDRLVVHRYGVYSMWNRWARECI